MQEKLSSKEQLELLSQLEERFQNNLSRHKGVKWENVAARLESRPERFWPLQEMERTGGEPDVIGVDRETSEIIFFDCSQESPKGRRSVCYDPTALASRKEHKPKHSALGMAEEMGIEILTEEEYRYLQTLGDFDMKTSSWIAAPDDIRNLGGAMFCDRRYGHVWTYHNGAESYYGARGFRGSLRA